MKKIKKYILQKGKDKKPGDPPKGKRKEKKKKHKRKKMKNPPSAIQCQTSWIPR